MAANALPRQLNTHARLELSTGFMAFEIVAIARHVQLSLRLNAGADVRNSEPVQD